LIEIKEGGLIACPQPLRPVFIVVRSNVHRTAAQALLDF
jgi:hypothetical protein